MSETTTDPSRTRKPHQTTIRRPTRATCSSWTQRGTSRASSGVKQETRRMVPMSFTGRGTGGSNIRLGLKEPHFPDSSNPLGEEIHSMPSSLIEDDDGVGTRADLGGRLLHKPGLRLGGPAA